MGDRRSGRTTAMLGSALDAQRKGKSVLVVAATGREQDRMRDILRAHLGATEEEARAIAFFAATASPQTLRGRRYGMVLVDHFVGQEQSVSIETLEALSSVEEPAASATGRGGEEG